jgi:phage baseplate assembly protein W
MGNVLINGLPTRPVENKNYKFTDIHLDLEYKSVDNPYAFSKNKLNDIKIDYDVAAIRNALVNLLTTAPLQKLLEPDFGLDLRRYLFLPATEEVANQIRNDIYTVINRYETRILLTSVNITIYEDKNEIEIDILFDVPSLNIKDVSLLGTLNSNGYVVNNS